MCVHINIYVCAFISLCAVRCCVEGKQTGHRGRLADTAGGQALLCGIQDTREPLQCPLNRVSALVNIQVYQNIFTSKSTQHLGEFSILQRTKKTFARFIYGILHHLLLSVFSKIKVTYFHTSMKFI